MRSDSWIGTKAAATLLSVSQRTIQKWIDDGKIVSTKTLGGHRRVSLDHLHALLAKENQPLVSTKSRPLTVVLVEDDPLIRQLCELNFQGFNTPYILHTANNGYEGLRLIGKYQPDLLLTDLRMPGIDGFEMIHELQASSAHQQLRIVVITGVEPEEIQQRGGFPEAITILSKPISFATLANIFAQRARTLGLVSSVYSSVDLHESE